MNEPQNDFGAELAEAAAEIHRLALLCKAQGIRKGPKARALLSQVNTLFAETRTMIAGAPTQVEVTEFTIRWRALAPAILNLMNVQGAQPQ